MKDPLKPRDKITQKMSRDGLVEVNETKETAERISRREQETDFSKQPEQAAQDTAAQLTSPGTFPKKRYRKNRARHGAYRRSADPASV